MGRNLITQTRPSSAGRSLRFGLKAGNNGNMEGFGFLLGLGVKFKGGCVLFGLDSEMWGQTYGM